MYTKLLRMVVKLQRQISGHCGGGNPGGSGHCS
jgi:hypothetical protein